MQGSDEVDHGGTVVEVNSGLVGSEGVFVFIGLRREWLGSMGGYFPAAMARDLAALLLKHADRAEGKQTQSHD